MTIVRLLVCALSCGGFAPAASAQLVRVPHTFVLLSPPPGFTETRAFNGFENRRDGWIIRVEELPPDNSELAAAFSSPEAANRMFGPDGVRITRIEQLVLDSGDVPLAIGVQKAFFGRELVKYMALMGGGGPDRLPVVIMFNLSRSSTLGRGDVEAVLRSVKIDRPTTLAEWLAVLPFTFREVPPFHTTTAGSGPTRADSGVATLAAFDDDMDRSRWLTIQIRYIGPTGNPPVEAAELNALRLRSFSTQTYILEHPEEFGPGPLPEFVVDEATILEHRTEVFAGGPGDFIVASAGERTVFLFLRVLDDTQVDFRAVGESRAMEDARPAIMDIARSVELRESALGPAE